MGCLFLWWCHNLCDIVHFHGVFYIYFSKRDEQLTYEELLNHLMDDHAVDLEQFDTTSGSSYEDPLPGTSTMTPKNKINLTVAYDMGWQRRSTGRRYNSLSGVGALVGNQTNKIISYGVRQKDCRTCTFYKHKHIQIPEHECHANFEGSSRAMEADLAAESVTDIERNSSVQIQDIIINDDSTTFARLRNELDHEINKISDIKHVTNSVQSALYKIGNTKLSKDVIKHLVRCVSYAIQQNKNNPTGLIHALKAIVPHSCGEHTLCGDRCGFRKDPHGYKHKMLPGGRDLELNDSLRRQLDAVIGTLCMKASAIAPCGSTRINENFNHMVASKAPKSRHYSSSGSLKTRVSAAVAQKNVGSTYLSQAYEKNGISPGKFYIKFATSADKTRKRQNTYKTSKVNKRRKLLFSAEKTKQQQTFELREGTTYQTKVDFQVTTAEPDTEEIPPPVELPQYEPLQNYHGANQIYFDLETSSLGKNCEIIQVAAYYNDNNMFPAYVTSSASLSHNIEKLTGITYDEDSGMMHQNGLSVDHCTIKPVIVNMIEWLNKFQPVVLVAHNAKVFDSERLVRAVNHCDLTDDFKNAVFGFADSLPFFWKNYKLKNYKQVTLAEELLGKTYDAHNAINDVQILHQLCYQHDLKDYSFSVSDVQQAVLVSSHLNKNLPSLQCLIDQCVLSKSMTERVAKSGLNMKHIRLAYQRQGDVGICTLFSERDRFGKLRVTKSKKVMDKLMAFLRCWYR